MFYMYSSCLVFVVDFPFVNSINVHLADTFNQRNLETQSATLGSVSCSRSLQYVARRDWILTTDSDNLSLTSFTN